MARRRGGLDLTTPRPLRLVEDLEGFSAVVMNREGSRLLGKNIMMFHVAMMVAFITVIGAPFAWIAALFNILLSPKAASWRVECTQHAVRITELYTRSEPGIAQATSDEGLTGPKVLGLGGPVVPLDLPFSEIARVGWSDHSLQFVMRSGEQHVLLMELTSPEDIVRLGEQIQASWAKHASGVQVSAEEADAERKKLAALLQRTPQS